MTSKVKDPKPTGVRSQESGVRKKRRISCNRNSELLHGLVQTTIEVAFANQPILVFDF
jgi:hypothetical protein